MKPNIYPARYLFEQRNGAVERPSGSGWLQKSNPIPPGPVGCARLVSANARPANRESVAPPFRSLRELPPPTILQNAASTLFMHVSVRGGAADRSADRFQVLSRGAAIYIYIYITRSICMLSETAKVAHVSLSNEI